MRSLVWLSIPWLVIAAPTSRAQSQAYRVARSSESIRLDARLAEQVWRDADSIVDFRQREPAEGAPASERTVLKVVRDGERLYVAVRAYDRDVRGIRGAQLRRDADLSSDDNITVLIDSYRDRRGAFLFRTNPNGAMWDGQLVGLDEVNSNWNGIWDVATRRDAGSWTAEFAIPFRTLRFKPETDIIGLNVRRFIRRKNEEDLWRSWGRAQGLQNLLNTGDVAGFGDIAHSRPAEVRPYVLGRAIAPSYDVDGSRIGSGSTDGKAGLDAKLGVSPTMTADLTLNTDFAQVEADQQVINLTRFPTFFPEKREFFLESSGLFDIGSSGRAQLFYSRRIGLDSTGVPVPIIGGARLYGKQGPWAIGLLDVRTGGHENANDVAVRIGHDVLDRSTVAAMVVDKSVAGRSERGAGFDMDFPLVVRGHNVEPHVWMMGTRTPGVAGTPLAWRLSTDYPNDLFDNFVSVYRIDDGFSPTMGFARRTGIWETTGHVDYMPRPGVFGIRRLDLTPIPNWDIITDRKTGDLTRPSTWQTAEFEWHVLGGEFQSGDQLELNVQRNLDAPADTFEVFRDITIAPGRYWWTTADVQYESSSGRPLSVEAVLSTGQFYAGHANTAELSGTLRAGGHLILNVGSSVTAARVPAGRFTATQLTGHVEYAFSTRASFLGFAQFENEDRRADFNLRFHWIPKIGDDVFVVWNSGFTTEPDAPWRFPGGRALSHPLNGALVVKAVHRFAR
ncbi:MAG TPA: DUF5916 domain-containing protein [Gemmatimonadaceae bacterium]|nr:DUF5916 domain-containing protein [Gemmatimonadaceae bacterium]